MSNDGLPDDFDDDLDSYDWDSYNDKRMADAKAEREAYESSFEDDLEEGLDDE